KALALIDDPRTAKELLDKADAMAHYARRIKADDEIVNAIQKGKLKIEIKLGELDKALSAKERGAKGGRGKKAASPGERAFGAPRIRASRRKAKAHEEKFDEYCQHVEHSNDDGEIITREGFLRFATGTEKAGRAAHVSANTGIPEWYTPAEYI